MKKVTAHQHYWLAENKQWFPDFDVIVKLNDPRVFIRFRTDLAFFASFEGFYDSIAEVQWIDGKPSEYEQNKILEEAWNFLAIEERILEDDIEDIELEEFYDEDDLI